MVIAVDFDDTLMDRNNVQTGFRMGQPKPGAIAATRRLVNEGHTVIIFTARNTQDPRVYKAIEDWCLHYGIANHGATNIKIPEFDVFIDNRAIAFDTWPQVLMRLTSMQNANTIQP